MADTEVKVVTQKVDANRDISLPQEWLVALGFNRFYEYAQLTLVCDKIAIHKPTATDKIYERACKVEAGSYIRRITFLEVGLPDQLLRPLGIKIGDNVDLTLADNCLEIRKHIEPEPEPIVKEEKPEPLMSFCCVCGQLYYTGNGLIKLKTKYICTDCVELVKEL
jgi:hypothetical protein